MGATTATQTANQTHAPVQQQQHQQATTASVTETATTATTSTRSEQIPVSQICAFRSFPSQSMVRVANSTPIVDLDSMVNSFLVNRESRLLFPTPESPIKTTVLLHCKVAVSTCSATSESTYF